MDTRGDRQMENQNQTDQQIAQQQETHGNNQNTMINQPENNKDLLRIRTGLPKHGTRWARAQNPTPERA
jgi:hypothetical protein